jgi:hypothetical protein
MDVLFEAAYIREFGNLWYMLIVPQFDPSMTSIQIQYANHRAIFLWMYITKQDMKNTRMVKLKIKLLMNTFP